MAHLQEIRQRLLERGRSCSSQSGSLGTSRGAALGNLAKPIVQETLYVYAADKTYGGMALAERWGLLLESTADSSSPQKRERRTSLIVQSIPDASPRTNDSANDAEKSENVFVADSGEENKDVEENNMPSVVIMENDYFQTDEKTKFQSQLETLKQRMERVAKTLPMSDLLATQKVQAEVRWEKTKDWGHNASKMESETTSVVV